MKKREIEKIFRKLDLKVRTTGHNYGWLVVDGKKVPGTKVIINDKLLLRVSCPLLLIVL